MFANLTCAVVCAVAVCCGCSAASDSGHRDIANADFEAIDKSGCATAWELPSGTGWSIAEGQGINGTRALCYDGDLGFKRRGIPFQWVEIDRSKKYLMEAWVRTAGLSGGGASICIQCHDRDGNVFYGKYSRDRVVDSGGDWVKISDVTGAGQFPEKAVKLSLCLFVQGKPRGKAYFDNVRLVPYELAKPVVAGVYSSAYRDSASDGDVVFHAAINMPETEFSERRPVAAYRFTSASGAKIVRKADMLSCTEASLSINVKELAFGTQPVEFVLADDDGNKLGKASVDFTRTESPVPRRVSIDRFNRTIVDGKPFFPLGAYVNHIDWNGETNLSVYCQAPFNCILPYALPQNRECLDLCLKGNLMVIASLYNVWAGTKRAWVTSEADEEPFIRKAVELCADHPAMLAWYLADELPLSMLPRMAKRRELMERLDPDHPTMCCVCQVDEMRDFMPAFDIVGSDPYPIGREQIKAHPISMAADWTRRTRAATFGARAMWQIPQMFDWDWFCRAGNPKFPTRDEFRNMSYQCIAEGANGLIYYHFSRFLRDDADFASHWPYVCGVIREIATSIPVFLLDPGPKPPACDDDRMSVRTWRDGEAVWVLAVNTTREPISSNVEFGASPGAVAEARFGVAPRIEVGKLCFDMAPLECALTRLEMRK